jgi:nucleotide-binding universal stress UspA family protein
MAAVQESAGRWRHVVVGVDGSPNSLAALRRAAGQACQRGAGIEIVYVIPAGSEPAAASAGYAMLAMAERCVAPEGFHVPSRRTVDLGDPAEVLAHRSAGAELLVIGGRFHSGHGNLLGGDVVPYCLNHSSCQVDICADQPAQPDEADPSACAGHSCERGDNRACAGR